VSFNGGCNWLYEEIAEATALGHKVKVVLVGPLTLLYLGKVKSGLQHKLDLLPAAIAGYKAVLAKLKAAGVSWVQIDEPILALELDETWKGQFLPTYTALAQGAPSLLLATYFDNVSEHQNLLLSLPVSGIHIDCVRGLDQLTGFVAALPQDKVLSVGIVNGRNIWRTDLDTAVALLKPVFTTLGDRLWVSSSCSLLHVPCDLINETKLDAESKSWMAYANQKISEISVIKQALCVSPIPAAVEAELATSRAVKLSRATSPRINNPEVKDRVSKVTEADENRANAFPIRIQVCTHTSVC
jgi:5-methyltetrahydropteroyltriglutamate--homocysteine methyltransferase